MKSQLIPAPDTANQGLGAKSEGTPIELFPFGRLGGHLCTIWWRCPDRFLQSITFFG